MKRKAVYLHAQTTFRLFIFHIIFIIVSCSFYNQANAQAPQGFSYQAVARTASGNLMANQTIQVRFNIISDSSTGPVVYQETKLIITNALGLFTHTVGQGTSTFGMFSTIDWGHHRWFLKVEMDTSGASNYVAMGTTQLMSVPFALYAGNAQYAANACARNGLSKSGDSIALGGSLSENTAIDLAGHNLTINNLIGSNVLSISQTNSTGSISLAPIPIGQTFTAVTTSQLSNVEVFLHWIAATTVTMSISNSNGTVLGTQILSLPNAGSNWTSFTFSSLPLLQQGQVYTLSLTSSNGGTVAYSSLNPYSYGNTTFNPSYDFEFKIYVINNLPVLTTSNQNVGIGISTPDTRLDVNGQLKIRGGLPGLGKILTSDATGLASWQLPVSDSKWDNVGGDIMNNNPGNVRIGSNSILNIGIPWTVHIAGSDSALKLTGSGLYGEFAQLNFGDANYVYVKEDQDDKLYFNANRFAFMSGNVGINTISPLAGLHVDNKNVLFSSPSPLPASPGAPPAIGAGSYMMWYSDKGAFRAGSVLGSAWSSTNTGVNSFAAGTESRAKGNAAISLGGYNNADGDWSFAAGTSNNCTANSSIALGSSSKANGEYSTCLGLLNQTNGTGSIAMGIGNIANGYACTVIGINNDSILASQSLATAATPLFIIGNGPIPANRSNAMVVRNNGRVGLGNNANTYQFEVSTNSAAKPSSSTWFISSDARLKNIDGNYTKGLSDIIRLNTILYHYKKGNELKLPSDQQSYGFIAQDVQKVFPECVNQNEDGYLSLDLHPLFVSYVNAFKELNDKVEEQDSQMKELKSEIELLKKLISNK